MSGSAENKGDSARGPAAVAETTKLAADYQAFIDKMEAIENGVSIFGVEAFRFRATQPITQPRRIDHVLITRGVSPAIDLDDSLPPAERTFPLISHLAHNSYSFATYGKGIHDDSLIGGAVDLNSADFALRLGVAEETGEVDFRVYDRETMPWIDPGVGVTMDELNLKQRSAVVAGVTNLFDELTTSGQLQQAN